MNPLLLIILMVLGSLAFGWIALVILGFVHGFVTQKERSWISSGLTAMGSWFLLLGWRAFNGDLAILLQSLESIINIPGWSLTIITLGLAGVLGGTGSNFGQQARRSLQKQSDHIAD